MAQTIQLRRGTAAAWTTANPILAQGEPGVETDTGKFKLGDGTTVWTSLGYATDVELLYYFKLNQATPQTVSGGSPLFTGGITLKADTAKAILGAGSDMSIWYDGTNGNIKTSDVAASDLNITCGAGKTIELQNSVYDDLPPVPVLSARLGSSAPTLATFVSGTEAYTFDATNDYVVGATEITHAYKEGTNISPHIHWATNGVDVGDTGVKWVLEYTVANSDESAPFGSAFGATSSPVIDTLIPGATPDRSHILSVFAPAITGTSLKIGAYIVWKLSRAASATAAPASDPFALAVGFHFEIDTMGSRTVSAK